jgi:long-chain acyl-CoA synthetase
MTESFINRVMARAHEGMEIAVVAAADPDRIALVSDQGEQTFAELNRQANQIARLLREQGIGAGDAVALVCSNRAEFAAVRFATHRIGARLTPVNWHLSAAEISYIVGNCEALALFADSRVAAAVQQVIADNPGLRLKLAIGGAIDGCQPYPQALADVAAENIDNPCLGTTMLYTSGTTGKPKGVLRKQPDPQAAAAMLQLMLAVFHYDPEADRDMALATGPLYHAGPFNICLTQPLSAGIGSVLMDSWDPEKTLSLIQRHHISHCFLVPTMFTRMLQLPPELRAQYDLSSLKFVIHGAAPCAIATKQQMLDWFGPIIWELFAGTEGAGTVVSPAEWLAHPGTVGKPGQDQIKIYDPNGAERGPGQVGTVYLKNPSGSAFEYFGDREKTLSVHRGDYFTAGDIGYLDEAGYLFLTGRSAELIIAGGVNIYPQEIDDVLAQHPAVLDVACVGVPNEEWGEEVKAVIALVSTCPASLELEHELLAFAQQRLSRQKWPRSIDFVAALPRSEAGKVQRSALRQRYWGGSGRQL